MSRPKDRIATLLCGVCALTLGPRAALAAPLGAGPVLEDEEFEGIQSTERHAQEDEHKRYFLIGKEGAKAPREGFQLLLVLPGGDGSADFNAFAKRIFQHALDEKYLLAQLVAPVWKQGQAETNVWPTQKNPFSGMEFCTEDFIEAVIADVEADFELDLQQIFTLGWSSSGSAVYAESLRDDRRVTGSFVAMSVFKPDLLPSLKGAKGHAYYILHSPEDFIPIRMAEAARDELSEAKAKVEFATYPGGHGWKGDVWGNMRAGISFLEKEHGKAAKVRRKSKTKSKES